MTEQKNIPELRFPDFNGEWDLKKLNEIASKIGDGIHGTPKYDVEGEYCFINGNNLVEGRILITENTKTVNEHEFQIHKRELNDRTILLSINGTIGNLAYYNGEEVMLGKSAAYINIAEKHDLKFNFYTLSTNRIQSYFNSELTGTTIKNLSLKTIRSTNIFLPTLPEQQKIASFFTAIDQKISQLKQKKTLLEQYKKGVMQKIFSQLIRFRDDNGQEFPMWEKKRLGELGNTYNGLTGKTKENFGTGKPYIQYKQIFDDSRIDVNRFGLVDIKSGEKQNKVEYGDIFFTTSSETPDEIGTASVLLDEFGELYLNSFCFGYRSFLNQLNPHYSRYLFRSELFRKDIMKLAQGSTRYNMSKVELMKLTVDLPSSPEQTKIANFLSAIDDKIDYTQTQINNAEHWKKGLLQKLFV